MKQPWALTVESEPQDLIRQELRFGRFQCATV
jgi:hypothetical protein